ncbi:unnamed protein product (macronuclear) [Paramecium tetraurelia]|uniref:U2A'/phosphoprotein 32 family A C-terminal domain-containing protein n=1 Tax=Paramecium tetraurelia TaxID=5888 RepID=A0DPD6_PARTE|nr:uncharacterized protein GSPATT00019085001 [Paramecium tetraurelia]CAK84903.1 unnamed protein product [Paramecium tetraurelia]|eukprot:XP_001452300.1 hypothetical protein (macronuclear) [Paramecium tetraurelia strain d4-2]
MKKKQTKKQQQQQQKKQTPLNSGQLIKLMDEQHKKGQYKEYPLYGLNFAKIPIITFTPEINKYLQKYPNESKYCTDMTLIASIGFTKCYLNSLEGLEYAGEKVATIIMNYNNLQGDSLLKISKLFPNITHLNLSHNQISKIEDLQHLNKFKKLEHLDLRFNPVKRYKDYRKIVFEQIPQLQLLDYDQDVDDSMDNSSRDNWLSSQVEESESEASFDDESSEDVKPKKKVKK